MTELTSPHFNQTAPIGAAADDARDALVDTTKRARQAVDKVVKSARETAVEVAEQTRTFAAEKAKVGAAWTSEKAKDAHRAAEDHPLGAALGAFAIGLGVGFLIARVRD